MTDWAFAEERGGWYDRRAERVGQQTERPIRSTKTSKRVTSAGEGEGL